MQLLTAAVKDWTDRHIKSNMIIGPDRTHEDVAEYVATISGLYSKSTLFLSTPHLLNGLWSNIVANPIAYDFVIHGTTHMELMGFTSLATRKQLIRHISDSLRWGSLTSLTSTEFVASTYKGNSSAGEDAILSLDPWVLFLTIFQNLPLSFEPKEVPNVKV